MGLLAEVSRRASQLEQETPKVNPTFADLGVPESICTALERRGITEPFAIQAATIADTLAGHDVCGRAPTGSGKTLAFGVPLVALTERAETRRPHSLVLAPTRELADQIAAELDTFAGRLRVAVVYGGVGYGKQLDALQRGVDILVACPGRLEDLIQMGKVTLEAVDCVVVDEADRMADMGFLPAVRRLLDQTSPSRQTLLFSATLDGSVGELTHAYQHDPVRHEVGEDTPDITAANHFFWNVERTDRPRVAAQAINAAWPAIVFCRTRHGADRLERQLTKQGVTATAIHGGRNQNRRTRALAEFADGRAQALVATDVAARGIHIDRVASVVHYDLPADPKDYIHRSGRTARGGEGGTVVALVPPDQTKDARRLQRHAGIDEPIAEPDATALSDAAPAPIDIIEHVEPAERIERRPKKSKQTRRRTRRSGRSAGSTRGTVKFFNNKKGFGFIAADGHDNDVFVHYSNIATTGYKSLSEGQLVEFDLGQGRKGDEARNVQPV
ncbi:MAG: DEAD/DEAH box helicase [Actinomycetota bacterium]